MIGNSLYPKLEKDFCAKQFLKFILGGSSATWKKISFFVAIPAVLICALNTYLKIKDHPHERAPFIKYDYLRKRDKRFPWGEGNKSLFHVSIMWCSSRVILWNQVTGHSQLKNHKICNESIHKIIFFIQTTYNPRNWI